MTSVAIAGASGYAGGEMARLISGHPEFELGLLTAERNDGRPIREIHPHLRRLPHDTFQTTDIQALAGHDIVVLALPHGHSGALGEQLLDASPDMVTLERMLQQKYGEAPSLTPEAGHQGTAAAPGPHSPRKVRKGKAKPASGDTAEDASERKNSMRRKKSARRKKSTRPTVI